MALRCHNTTYAYLICTYSILYAYRNGIYESQTPGGLLQGIVVPDSWVGQGAVCDPMPLQGLKLDGQEALK